MLTQEHKEHYASLSGPIEPIRAEGDKFPGSHHHRWLDVVSPVRAGVKTAVRGVATCEFPIEEKFKTLPSAGKVTYNVFWDRKGVILVDFLEPG